MAKKEKKAEEKKPAKRGAAPPTTRAERAAALIEHVKDKMGGRAELCLASDLSMPYITKRMPTGLLRLDLALRGGFPSAGISQIIGPKNAGKSMIYWYVIRMLQAILGQKMHVMMAMTEMRADRTQGRLCGVHVALSDEDIASMERARVRNGGPKYTAEERRAMKYEVGHIHEAHGMSGEDLYDVVLRAVEQRIYHLIIIDSFGNIMSGAESESESMHDKTYGGSAGVNTQFIHKLTNMLLMKTAEGETRDTCIIGINQIRDDIKNPHAPYKSSGGRALEHAKFVDLYLAGGKSTGKDYGMRTPSGLVQRHCQCSKEVNWEIKKGKAGISEGGKGNFEFVAHKHDKENPSTIYTVNNADFIQDTLEGGKLAGVVGQEGSWWSVLDYAGNVVARAQGMDKMIDIIEQDLTAKQAAQDPNTLMRLIQTNAYRAMDINIDYNWD
jgi:RecA/RadA recombinase